MLELKSSCSPGFKEKSKGMKPKESFQVSLNKEVGLFYHQECDPLKYQSKRGDLLPKESAFLLEKYWKALTDF